MPDSGVADRHFGVGFESTAGVANDNLSRNAGWRREAAVSRRRAV